MVVSSSKYTYVNKYGGFAFNLAKDLMSGLVPVIAIGDKLAFIAEMGVSLTDDSKWYFEGNGSSEMYSFDDFVTDNATNGVTSFWGNFWKWASKSNNGYETPLSKLISTGTGVFVSLGGIPEFEESDKRLKDEVGDFIVNLSIYDDRVSYEKNPSVYNGDCTFIEIHFDTSGSLKRYCIYEGYNQ